MNQLMRLFFPSGAFALAALVVILTGARSSKLYLLADPVFIIASVMGLFFTLRFGASRQFFTVLMLIGLGLGASVIIPADPASMSFLSKFYYCLATALVPLHCALFAWWRERGLLNFWGAVRLVWLVFVPVLAVFLGTFPAFFQHTIFINYFCNNVLDGILLPVGPAVICGVCWLFMLFLYSRDISPNYEGFFWVSVLLAAGFFFCPEPVSLRLVVAAAMIVLLLSMIEAGLFFAYRDELTGLPARRALNSQLQKLGGKYTIAMIDVDHFKRFNDRYGHDVGDEVLKMVATRLKKSSGKAYRYGGEEFTLIYPGKGIDQVELDAEAVRALVAEASFTIRKPPRRKGDSVPPERGKKGARQTVSVTVSMGLAERSGTTTAPEQVLKAADKALYKAKKNGRNRLEKAKQ